MDGYLGQPLVKKLGIKADMVVGLMQAPPEFLQPITELPVGARLHHGINEGCDLIIWFIRSHEELTQSIVTIITHSNFRFISILHYIRP
jgi:hypothetical protein